jgi:hypothetical protein
LAIPFLHCSNDNYFFSLFEIEPQVLQYCTTEVHPHLCSNYL